jgi:hypothetical protein
MSVPLCDTGTHIVAKMERGLYVCANCGLGFREHHELHLTVGTGAQQHRPLPPSRPAPAPPRPETR